MVTWGKEAGLKSFEQVSEKRLIALLIEVEIVIFSLFIIFFKVKDVYLHPDPFSVQNGLLTPTFKTRRPQLKSYFKPQLDDMYKNLD